MTLSRLVKSRGSSSTPHLCEKSLWSIFKRLWCLSFYGSYYHILACKLMAGGVTKDFADIEALCQRLNIQNRAQAQAAVDKYFSSPIDQAVHLLPQTLEKLFEE